MKRFLICLFSFLFIGCSIAGGAVLLSNSSYSDEYRGGDSSNSENDVTKNAPTNEDFWTDEGNYADSFAGGTGIETDPYQIATAEQLAYLAYLINDSTTNSTYKSLYYVQTANIDLSLHYWDAIGTYTNDSSYLAFAGSFNGGNFTISGLFTPSGSTSDYSYQGLFGYVRGTSLNALADIFNVRIENSDVQGYNYVGGIIGSARYADIHDCYNYGDVSGSGSTVGGIVGGLDNSMAYSLYNSGNISGVSSCGGIVGSYMGYYRRWSGGYISPGLVFYSCNYGNVTATNRNVGGIIGYGRAFYCFNSGYISSETPGTSYYGGISGYGDVYTSYNIGDISVVNGSYAGGITGYGSAHNCVVDGEIYTLNNIANGVFTSLGSAYNCYRGENCNLELVESTSISLYDCGDCTESDMKDINWYLAPSNWSASYPQWYFGKDWTFVDGENNGYPVLTAVYDGERFNTTWLDNNYATSFAGGLGTETDPYQIATAEQLAYLSYLLSNQDTYNDFYNKNYQLISNIDLSAYWWIPIGSRANSLPFMGEFDGNSHTISGITVQRDYNDSKGLFSYAEEAVIHDLSVSRMHIQSIIQSISATRYSGGIVGYGVSLHIYNCNSNGMITSESIGDINANAGGIVGYVVVGSESNNPTIIENCYNYGTINGRQAGGIAGYIYGTDVYDDSFFIVTNCYNFGKIGEVFCNNSFSGHLGGIVGSVYINSGEDINGYITNCYNIGEVGYNNTYLTYLGGICGRLELRSGSWGDLYMSNVVNLGYVNTRYSYDGAIVGTYPYANISNAYWGGDCTLTNAYASSNTTGVIENTGSCTVENAQDESWYVNAENWNEEYLWDFADTWEIVSNENEGYPTLKNEELIDVIVYHDPSVATYSTTVKYAYDFKHGKTSKAIKENMFTRGGYVFAGWSTEEDGSGVSYEPGEIYSGSGYLTLYAQWDITSTEIVLDWGVTTSTKPTSIWFWDYTGYYYLNRLCTSRITSLSSYISSPGFTFNGFYSGLNGLGEQYVDSTGAIVLTTAPAYTTWHAHHVANNPAYYDEEGGYWYIENGRAPQSRVEDETLKTYLEENWDNLNAGTTYHFGGWENITTKVYNGEEYMELYGNYYLVEPIRWRIISNGNQEVGYGEVSEDGIMAVMDKIIYLGRYAGIEISAGEGYSDMPISYLLNPEHPLISDEFLVEWTESMPTFGSTSIHGGVKEYTGKAFVSSIEEIEQVTGSRKVEFSDYVEDLMVIHKGVIPLCYTRDLGSNYNNVLCLNENGDITQRKPNLTVNQLGVQFTIKISEYACVER